jgi:hypothetical protein
MIWIEIRCDKCGIVGISRSFAYAHQLRAELKKQGWTHRESGSKDFCPRHKPRRRPRARVTTTIELVNDGRKKEVG